jgi:preprotein translocase subunit SecA
MELFEEAKVAYESDKEKLDAEVKGEGLAVNEIRLRDYVVNKLKQQVEYIVDEAAGEETLTEDNIEKILNELLQIMPRQLLEEVIKGKFEVDLSKFLAYLNQNPTKERIKEGFVTMREIEKYVMLDSIDRLWIDHLENMEDIRSGAGLQGYGQKDPLHIYQNEGYILFSQMMSDVDMDIARRVLLFTARIEREAEKIETAASVKSAARLAQEALENAFRDSQAVKANTAAAAQTVADAIDAKSKTTKNKSKKKKNKKK